MRYLALVFAFVLGLAAAPCAGQALYRPGDAGLYLGVEGATNTGAVNGVGVGVRFASYFNASVLVGRSFRRGSGSSAFAPALGFAAPVYGSLGVRGSARYSFGVNPNYAPAVAGQAGEAALSSFYRIGGAGLDAYPSLGGFVQANVARHGGVGTWGMLMRLPVAFDLGSNRFVLEPTYRLGLQRGTRAGAEAGLSAYLNF
jgi:hypothetical protein